MSERQQTSQRMNNNGLRSRGAGCDDGAFSSDDTVRSDTARVERSTRWQEKKIYLHA